MKEKLLAHFRKFGPRRFVIFAVVTLIISDLLNSWYLKLWWVTKNMSFRGVEMTAQRLDMTVGELTPASISEMTGMFDNMFYFFILIILVNNFFFYAFYLRRKLWAQGFVLFYTLTAAMLSALFLLDNAGLGLIWYAYNVLMTPLYLYLYFGVKVLKEETVDLPVKK